MTVSFQRAFATVVIGGAAICLADSSEVPKEFPAHSCVTVVELRPPAPMLTMSNLVQWLLADIQSPSANEKHRAWVSLEYGPVEYELTTGVAPSVRLDETKFRTGTRFEVAGTIQQTDCGGPAITAALSTNQVCYRIDLSDLKKGCDQGK